MRSQPEAGNESSLLRADGWWRDRWITLDIVVKQHTGDDHGYERDRQEDCVGIVSGLCFVSHGLFPLFRRWMLAVGGTGKNGAAYQIILQDGDFAILRQHDDAYSTMITDLNDADTSNPISLR